MFDFTILIVPGAYAASVAITQDVLRAAATLAQAPRMKSVQPVWRVVSPNGGRVALSGDLSIETKRMPLRRIRDTSTWIVPGLGIDRPEDVERLLTNPAVSLAATWLKGHVEGGGSVAASCSAVFLLQAAGLLRGRRATTSWWLAPELRRLEPDCNVDADRMVINDGPVTTAGAALGQADLMLNLIQMRFSPALAYAVGKVLLIDGRQAQSRYVVPTMLANGHELIGRLMHHIESTLPQPPSVTGLAKAFAMSQRTLSRRVGAATGQSPLDLIQAVRLHRARQLIESSRMSVDQVAAAVGYEDASASDAAVIRCQPQFVSSGRSGLEMSKHSWLAQHKFSPRSLPLQDQHCSPCSLPRSSPNRCDRLASAGSHTGKATVTKECSNAALQLCSYNVTSYDLAYV